MLADLNKTTAAKEWLDANANRWRLQTMQTRGRYNVKDGTYRELPVKVRRFLNGTPVGYIHEVMKLLKDAAPYNEPVFNMEDGHDVKYWPTSTAITKDSPENTTNGRDATYTIVQDLRLCDDPADDLDVTDETRCTSVSTSEHRWDEGDVEACPDAEQGVTWQVAGVSRSEETGLFSYALRRQQALTQHVPAHVAKCTETEIVTVETWDNLYGEPGSFRQDPVNGASAPVALPEPCDQPDGTAVELSIQANPDCTYRVSVQTATAKPLDLSAFSIYRDQYKIQDTVRDLNQSAPLAREGVEYSGGVVTKYSSERNPDGSYNNSTERETEREVASSTVEERVTPRGTVVTRVDTNVKDAATAVPGEYGSFKATKTPGGLFVNEYVEFKRKITEKLGLSCSDTKYLHTHETTSTVDKFGEDHVVSAGGGVVHAQFYDLGDDGSIVRKEQVREEHSVERASVTRRVTRRGKYTRVENKSVKDGPSVVDGVSERGTSASYTLTDGGLYDTVVESFSWTAGTVLGTSCTDTAFVHTHRSDTVASALQDSHVAKAAGGVVVRVDYSEDEQGVVTKSTTTTAEHAVENAMVSKRVGFLFNTNTYAHRSVSAAKKASVVSDARAVGSEVQASLTDGNMWNVQVTKLDLSRATGKTLSTSCATTVFQHVDESSTTVAQASDAHETAGGGVHSRTTYSTDANTGVVTKTTTVTKEVSAPAAQQTVQVTLYGTRTSTLDRNAKSYSLDAGTRPGDSVSVRENDGGSFDVETVRNTVNGRQTGASCQKDRYHHTTSRSYAQETMPSNCASGGSNGVRGDTSAQLTAEGAVVVQNQTYQETTVPSSRVSVRVSRNGMTRTTTDTQTPNPGTEPTADDTGKTYEREVTPGGLYNVTTTSFTPTTGPIGSECRRDFFSHDTTTTTVENTRTGEHVDRETSAGSGFTSQRQWTRNDDGAWTKTDVRHDEIERAEGKVDEYEDAFGKRHVKRTRFGTDENVESGVKFSKETSLDSVQRERTPGGRWTVSETHEEPSEVDSGWLTAERSNKVGASEIGHTWIMTRTFRNIKLSKVKSWITELTGKTYTGFNGKFSSNPSISVSANKFGLYDGTLSLHTEFTGKESSYGGNDPDKDSWKTPVELVDVQFTPISKTKSFRKVTKETHLRGGGIGYSRLKDLLSDAKFAGSQFSYHPGGQSYSFDIITEKTTSITVVNNSETMT